MTEITKLAEPEPKLTVFVNDKDVELFMSFGLIDSLLKVFTEAEPVEDMSNNPNQRVAVLKMVLKKRGQYGLDEDFDPDTASLDVVNMTKIFEWVLDHVTDFFIKQAEAAIRISEKYKEKTGSLAPSVTGSTA